MDQDLRRRAVHGDQALDPLREQLRDGPCHPAAPVVPDDRRLVSAHRIDHRHDVGGEVVRGVGAVLRGPG